MPKHSSSDALAYRRARASQITGQVGVYALCDLDEVPIYVGQSEEGIRARVRRHLTSARSDVIANRQLDVWEVAYVWAWPVSIEKMNALENHLFHVFDDQSPLMNGSIPPRNDSPGFPIPEKQRIQVMDDEEIQSRREPARRLPRQVEHLARLVDHILNVKDSPELRRSLEAHFQRLVVYHDRFLRS